MDHDPKGGLDTIRFRKPVKPQRYANLLAKLEWRYHPRESRMIVFFALAVTFCGYIYSFGILEPEERLLPVSSPLVFGVFAYGLVHFIVARRLFRAMPLVPFNAENFDADISRKGIQLWLQERAHLFPWQHVREVIEFDNRLLLTFSAHETILLSEKSLQSEVPWPQALELVLTWFNATPHTPKALPQQRKSNELITHETIRFQRTWDDSEFWAIQDELRKRYDWRFGVPEYAPIALVTVGILAFFWLYDDGTDWNLIILVANFLLFASSVFASLTERIQRKPDKRAVPGVPLYARNVALELSPDKLRMTLDGKDFQICWSPVKEVIEKEDQLLITFSPSEFLSLSEDTMLSDMPWPEARQKVQEWFKDKKEVSAT